MALDIYKLHLRTSIERTQRRLSGFERRYGVTTVQFLDSMTAEDLEGGDLEYVDWAGEAKIREGLKSELAGLEDPMAKASPIDALHGRFAGRELLGDLEQEHRRELEIESPCV